MFQYAMKDIAKIKGREFLMCRTFRSLGDEILEAARSFDFTGAECNPQKIRSDTLRLRLFKIFILNFQNHCNKKYYEV